MTSEPTPLLDRVADMLERSHVPFALIGAAALAVHGVSRSTLDIDLLATDRRLLDATFWTALPEAVRVDIRQGDSTDPLAGVVRCRAAGERDVDVVLGKESWQADLLARAVPTTRGSRSVPTVRVDDLILLKLYAGGSQDRWDIEQLLERPDRPAIVAGVEARLPQLPPASREMWRRLLVSHDA